MRDIRVKMWCKDGVPYRMELQFNGIPQARQVVSPMIFEGISEYVVMLDEGMGPDFRMAEYKDPPRDRRG
jgi:hypothetical protein